jgi:phosphoribosylformylglycinamidine synthase
MYKASVQITLRSSILDPQGKATQHALHNLGYSGVDRVRIGKHIEMWIDVTEEAEAERIAHAACKELLSNQVMEDYEISIEKDHAGATR